MVQSMNKELLKAIPQVDVLIREAKEILLNESMEKGQSSQGEIDLSLLTHTVREKVDTLRREILEGEVDSENLKEDLISGVINDYYLLSKPILRKVINATGIVLHTNLGRAPLSREAADAAYDAATAYSNLEFNIETGKRGQRYDNVEGLVCRLTNAESALVVNNNAAAVMLILHALGYKKNMVISRGELVEIGGSFRIPAVMEISGVSLKEVGCTNKTYIEDYESAIDEDTAAILKVHTSNFAMLGFTHEASVKELVDLGKKKNIPVIYDMGSGSIDELQSEANICCVSGDKLLGGPQCGVIYGDKLYLDLIKKDNLLRALRVDKMTLAALEATLRAYENNEKEKLPVNRLLHKSIDDMEKAYERITAGIRNCPDLSDGEMDCEPGHRGMMLSKVYSDSYIGGGSKPLEKLDNVCICLKDEEYEAEKIAKFFRSFDIPIIGRIHEDGFLLDLRCIEMEDEQIITDAINRMISENI